MVLCLGFQKEITCPVYQKCWTQNRTRFVDISKLASSLGDSICDSLIGLHAFTGCDTVSAFAGRGKLNALKMMRKNSSHQVTFSQLGQSWNVSAELCQKIEQFTSRMYVANTSTRLALPALRCTKRGEVESSQLPPCRDCLFLHVQRANYQAGVWKCCLQANPVVPNPTEHAMDGQTMMVSWPFTGCAPHLHRMWS